MLTLISTPRTLKYGIFSLNYANRKSGKDVSQANESGLSNPGPRAHLDGIQTKPDNQASGKACSAKLKIQTLVGFKRD